MSDVPSELYREILVRLPAESLFQFRSVCKSWLRIIDDPSFIKDHTNNQTYNHTLLVKEDKTLYSFSLDSLDFIKGLQKIEASRIKQLIRRGVPRLPPLFNVASCNGLILLSHEDNKKIWAIWNPLTGDCHELPRPNAAVSSDGFGFGFGYDADSDDYKVVMIKKLESAGKGVIQTHVYSLKSESWSMIKDSPGCVPLLNPGVFSNGTLYWISGDLIMALDLGTESYSRLPLPPEIIASKDCRYRLNALDGCLIFCLNHFSTCVFDGWAMEDNGAEKSWVKQFSLQLPDCVFEHPVNFKLVAYLKGKQQAVLQYSRGFAWFDIGNNSVLSFSVDGFPCIAASKICPGSLVRLGTAVAATTTSTKKRKRNSKKRDSSLMICVKDDEDYCCFGDPLSSEYIRYYDVC